MIYMYVIFDINNNLMFETCFVLEPCSFSILFGKIMNIETRTLCMYKAYFDIKTNLGLVYH